MVTDQEKQKEAYNLHLAALSFIFNLSGDPKSKYYQNPRKSQIQNFQPITYDLTPTTFDLTTS